MKKIISLALSLILFVGCFSVFFMTGAAAAHITAESELTSLSVYCETDKDPIFYNCGDPVTFTFTVMDNGHRVTVPELRYTLRGDDGTKKTGIVKANADDKYVIQETCIDMAGYMYLEVNAYGTDGKIWKSKLEEKASHLFQGGILVNAFALEAFSDEPEDFDEFWEESLAKLAEYPADLVGLRELPDDGTSLKKYEVYINCYGREADTKTGDTFVAGYLAVPKNAKKGSLRIQVNYQGQGLGKISAYGGSDRIMFNCLAHSVNLTELAEMSNSGQKRENIIKHFLNVAEDDLMGTSPMYGMSAIVAENKEDVYYRNMLLRDVQAINFLIKYFSDDSTATEFDGVDISSWAGLWDGYTVRVEGGSQGGFQAIGVAALHPQVTELSASIPWLCDIGAGTSASPRGTRITAGNRPKYAIGYDYVDTIFMAKRVTCKTTIKAGLGDLTCPPSGTMAMYNNLVQGKEIDATLELKQGRTHGYNPDNAYVSKLEGEYIGITGWSIKDGILYVEGSGVLDSSTPEASEWNERISEVTEIRINGAFTAIGEGAFELENKANVYIYCPLQIADRAFGTQKVTVFVPEGIKIDGAVSLGKLSKNNAFLYSMQGDVLILKAAMAGAILDFSESDPTFRDFINTNKDSIKTIHIEGEFAAVGKLKPIVELLTNCTTIKIDEKTKTLTSTQNFASMTALQTLGHWDFYNEKGVSYTEGVVDLTGFTVLLEIVDAAYNLPEGMFSGCKSIKKLVLPATLTCGTTSVAGRIPKNFLRGCTALEEIYIPEGVTIQSIEYDAFKKCESLKTVYVNGSVSPNVSIVFEYAKVNSFADIPAECKFVCVDAESAQKLNELFAGAGLSITAVASDGGAAVPTPPEDTPDTTPVDSDDKASEGGSSVTVIAAVAGGIVVVVAIIVIAIVAGKKKKK